MFYLQFDVPLIEKWLDKIEFHVWSYLQGVCILIVRCFSIFHTFFGFSNYSRIITMQKYYTCRQHIGFIDII